MKKKEPKKALSITPLELIDIFYDEARRIASSDDEAVELTNEALNDFLSHYKLVKKRSKRTERFADTHLALG